MMLDGFGWGCSASRKSLVASAAMWRPAISALKTLVCSPSAPLLSNTFWPLLMIPYPVLLLPLCSVRDLSEYMNKNLGFSSFSAMKLL